MITRSLDLTVTERRIVALMTTVPNVVGLQEGAAAPALRQAGLDVGTVTKVAGARPGEVVAQSPPADARVARGTKVDISVAVKAAVAPGPPAPPGPPKPPGLPKPPGPPTPPAAEIVTVPNVVGMALGQARQALTGAGLETGSVSRKKVAGAQRGRVAEQTPAAGARAAKGSKVDLVLGF